MDAIRRQVARARPGDVGRSICRLDAEARDHLDVEPGDTVTLNGSSTTSATVWRLHREADRDVVRIGDYLRRNAGVEIDNTVTVRKATPVQAESVQTTVIDGDKRGLVDGSSDWLNANLISRPVQDGDVFLVNKTLPRERQPPLQQTGRIRIDKTDPDGPVMVENATDLHVEG